MLDAVHFLFFLMFFFTSSCYLDPLSCSLNPTVTKPCSHHETGRNAAADRRPVTSFSLHFSARTLPESVWCLLLPNNPTYASCFQKVSDPDVSIVLVVLCKTLNSWFNSSIWTCVKQALSSSLPPPPPPPEGPLMLIFAF